MGCELRDERVLFRVANGRSTGDDKTDVVEEGAIGDELVGGPSLVCWRRV